MRKFLMFVVAVLFFISNSCFAEMVDVRIENISVEVPRGFKVLDYSNNNKDLIDLLNSGQRNKKSKSQYIEEFREQGVVFYAYNLDIFTDLSIISHTPDKNAVSPFDDIFEGRSEVTPKFINLSKKYFREVAGLDINDVVLRTYNNVRYLEITTVKDYMYIKAYITKNGNNVLTYMIQTPPESKNTSVPMIINFLEKVVYKGAVKGNTPKQEQPKVQEQPKTITDTKISDMVSDPDSKGILAGALYESLKGFILAGIAAALYHFWNRKK